MTILMGHREMEMNGSYMTELKESNDILDDMEALRQRMDEDGYLFIRNFHDADQVMEARKSLLQKMEEKGRLQPGTPLMDGIIGPENKGAMFQGLNHDLPELLKLVNSDKIMSFYDQFLGGPSLTYDHKWARGVGKGEFSGAHYDIVYMGRGTKRLYTTWTPLGDISYDMGGLAICLGSQHFQKLKETYGEMDVDRDKVTGWFSDDPIEIIEKFGGKWATAEFKAGDVLLFGMFTMHASLTNTTNQYRLSVDTRYQLASEPYDDRWYGKNLGHYAWQKGATVTMEEARSKWGV
jgi:ectoine hydroxylase-related dioxygenase (phytanoyl-CoA dioxygenase family)